MNANIPNPWKFQFYFNELKHYHYVFRWSFKMWDSEWHGGYSRYTRDGQDLSNDDSFNLFMFLFAFGIAPVYFSAFLCSKDAKKIIHHGC